MTRTRALVAAVLLACLIMPGTARQNPTQPVPRFRTGVELVQLDVSVLDRDRLPVHGLTANDFTVLEDGHPQAIQTFTEIELPDTVTKTDETAPWVRSVVPDVQKNSDFKDARILVIAMDDATPMPAPDIPLAKRMARRAIEQLGPSDIACVVYALDKKSGQEFTRDRARLLASVERFNGAIPLGSANGFDVSALTMYISAVNTLTAISEDLSELPQRRKALMWVSIGIPIDWEAAQSALISLDSPGNASTSSAVQSVIREARKLLEAAQHANVTIYGLDPRGLMAPAPYYDPFSGATTFDSNPGKLNRDFLQGISFSSGGFAVTDTNDPLPGIKQVFRENSSYYLLGYAASNLRADGRFRKIEVKVNRPDVAVRTRTGYFEPRRAKGQPAMSKASAVETSLAGLLPNSDLTMQVSPVPFAVAGQRKAAVAVIVGIRQPAPARGTAAGQRIDMQVAAFSPGGQRKAGRHERVDVTLNYPGASALIGYETFSQLELEPGRYQLRVAAESSLHGIRLTERAPEVGLVAEGEGTASRSGSVYSDLDVPDFLNERLSLSGVALSVSPGVVSGPKARLASLIPVVPTTLRDFTAGDQVTAFVRVYQGGKEPVAAVMITKRVVDERNVAVVHATETLGADRFGPERAADCVVEIPVERLSRGPHLFTIEARLGDKVVRREVRFEVH